MKFEVNGTFKTMSEMTVEELKQWVRVYTARVMTRPRNYYESRKTAENKCTLYALQVELARR